MEKVIDNVYIIKPFDPNVVDCCVYLIDSKSDDGLILIDAGVQFEPIEDIEKDGFKLRDIKHCLITHGHIDHFGVCYKLKEFNKDIKFYAHELDVEKIEQKPTEPSLVPFFATYDYEPVIVTNKIKKDNEILKFGNLAFQCIHIPGHTPGSVAYLLEIGGKTILFGGDLPGIAINLRGGNLDQYVKSLQKLLKFKIDFSCEGHEIVIQPSEEVKKSIKAYIQFNKNVNTVVTENPYDKDALFDIAKFSYELGWYDNALEACTYLLEIDPENIEAQKLLQKVKEHNPPKTEFLKGYIKIANKQKK
ncbi:MAG: MBL fold metallo-hydrolase [Promethearchaeota archaeon]|jgi:glyoxylase-like metal-dependent hydrolase (beta-lactamase superfamily II)